MTAVNVLERMNDKCHYPVMWKEVLVGLQVSKCRTIVDCTAGVGAHASKILENSRSDSFYIGLDKDSQSLRKVYNRLEPFAGRFVLLQEDFINLDRACREFEIKEADLVLFDLGISTYQLADQERGFSFSKEARLDMRMNKDNFVTAYDLVNNLSQQELADIFKKFGEERYAKRIAQAIARRRRHSPVSTTTQLAKIIERSVPPRSRFGRINPATRIFQALRIAVNRELELLRMALPKAVEYLGKGGRIGVISFHSLEDRIVKHSFRSFANRGLLKIITKKPWRPQESEIEDNPASRSAKLRIAEKIK